MLEVFPSPRHKVLELCIENVISRELIDYLSFFWKFLKLQLVKLKEPLMCHDYDQ